MNVNEDTCETCPKTIYIVGDFHEFGRGGRLACSIDIDGVYDSREAAERAIADFNEDRISTLPGAGPVNFEIHELPLNVWRPV